MVDLKGNPFYLDEEGIKWVKDTLASMSLHEKICQLFADPLQHMSAEQATAFLKENPLSAVPLRARILGNDVAQDVITDVQNSLKIPVLFVGNCESGGNGCARNGTLVATAAQAGATRDLDAGYQIGRISGAEMEAMGFNCNWGPTGDILMNWRNCLVNTRCFGDDATLVSNFVEAFNKGLREHGVVPTLKHFPGDGWEERDQHLAVSNNGLTCEEWDNTFGKIYKNSIDNGLLAVMVGHFTLPAYQKFFNPYLEDKDMETACNSPELINGLLRSALGFNGMVVTDQTAMMGYYTSSRPEAIRKTIAAGCDIVLGINDWEEDYAAMKSGIESGYISAERFEEALLRVLATKAAINLHKQKEAGFKSDREKLKIIACDDHQRIADEISDKAITLVKNSKNQLPITSDKYKKIGLVVLNASTQGASNTMAEGVVNAGSATTSDVIKAELEAEGFEVIDILNTNVAPRVPLRKGKTSDFVKNYDAVMIFADITSFASSNTIRIQWPGFMNPAYPWYVNDVPVVFVSLNLTNHLFDVARVPTFINAYNSRPGTIRHVVKKIAGKSPFTGEYDENVWCGAWDTHF